MTKSYVIENGLVYEIQTYPTYTNKSLIGDEIYTETTETEIITYKYDTDLGRYVETGRTTI
jgi:hypothetical protein